MDMTTFTLALMEIDLGVCCKFSKFQYQLMKMLKNFFVWPPPPLTTLIVFILFLLFVVYFLGMCRGSGLFPLSRPAHYCIVYILLEEKSIKKKPNLIVGPSEQ